VGTVMRTNHADHMRTKEQTMKLLPDLSPMESEEIDLPPDATSLDFLRGVYRDARLPLSVRMRAAIAALAFEHPKLTVNANINAVGFADRMERMMERRGLSAVIDAHPARAD
jgi:hypothetical protein